MHASHVAVNDLGKRSMLVHPPQVFAWMLEEITAGALGAQVAEHLQDCWVRQHFYRRCSDQSC